MTNDEIELPELPPEVDWVNVIVRGEKDQAEVNDYYYTQDQMRDYARAAVEADRARHVRPADTSQERVKETGESEHERAQAAEPVATMHVGMFGSTGFTGLDAGAKLPEGDYQLYTHPERPAVTEEMVERVSHVIAMLMAKGESNITRIATAAIEAALGGGDEIPR